MSADWNKKEIKNITKWNGVTPPPKSTTRHICPLKISGVIYANIFGTHEPIGFSRGIRSLSFSISILDSQSQKNV